MSCTPTDFAILKAAIRTAIVDGRQLEPRGPLPSDALDIDLLAACRRLADDPSPVLLQALGNHAVLCLMQADCASARTVREIKKLMG